jgi:hypothetical protein
MKLGCILLIGTLALAAPVRGEVLETFGNCDPIKPILGCDWAIVKSKDFSTGNITCRLLNREGWAADQTDIYVTLKQPSKIIYRIDDREPDSTFGPPTKLLRLDIKINRLTQARRLRIRGITPKGAIEEKTIDLSGLGKALNRLGKHSCT